MGKSMVSCRIFSLTNQCIELHNINIWWIHWFPTIRMDPYGQSQGYQLQSAGYPRPPTHNQYYLNGFNQEWSTMVIKAMVIKAMVIKAMVITMVIQIFATFFATTMSFKTNSFDASSKNWSIFVFKSTRLVVRSKLHSCSQLKSQFQVVKSQCLLVKPQFFLLKSESWRWNPNSFVMFCQQNRHLSSHELTLRPCHAAHAVGGGHLSQKRQVDAFRHDRNLFYGRCTTTKLPG